MEVERRNAPLGPLEIGPGTRSIVKLPVSQMSNGAAADLQVMVIRGRKPGPTLFVSAAVHGDEIVGVEIIRRLAGRPSLTRMRGTLLLVPIVNGYGFLNQSRYLPDRRDLNRVFPGSPRGSLAARLANVFLNEVVLRSDMGIDLHTAAVHRENLPQIRVNEGDQTAMEMALVFGAPAILKASLRDGSLRKSAAEAGVPLVVFEAGEALRFNEVAVRSGLGGVLRVMRHIGMIQGKRVDEQATIKPFVAGKGSWVRASNGGLVRLFKKLGDPVTMGERIGEICDPFGTTSDDVVASCSGIIIGRSNHPVVNEGDAVVHIARSEQLEAAAEQVEQLVEQLDSESMFFEDEIL